MGGSPKGLDQNQLEDVALVSGAKCGRSTFVAEFDEGESVVLLMGKFLAKLGRGPQT
jgi:hypothetical protein